MRPRGFVITPPDSEPAQCYPSKPSLTCNLCTRRRRGEPFEDRLHVVIDASAVGTASRCVLFIGRAVARPFQEAA